MRKLGRAERIQVISYDISRFKFREWFCDLLGIQDLERLHQHYGVNADNYRIKVSSFQKVCDGASPSLAEGLNEFFASVISGMFGPIAARQPHPTFRSHFAVPDAVLLEEAKDFGELDHAAFLKKHYFDNYRPGIFHRDKDYGLADGTVNAWLPMTEVAGTNSLWIGGRTRTGMDAAPIALRYGQCLMFDGAHRWHGAVWNTSDVTRVSSRHTLCSKTPSGIQPKSVRLRRLARFGDAP